MSDRIILLFHKMHGLGNDYVVIDESTEELIPEDKKGEISAELCTRGFSVGADGVIFVSPSIEADIRFRIFNSDGSEAQMCGNGIRCFAKYVFENDVIKEKQMSVETLGGIKELTLQVENSNVKSIKVDMGTATFKTSAVPMATDEEEFIDQELLVDGEPLKLTAISVGNPHAIIFTDNLEDVALDHMGPIIENHKAFPERINVHFVGVVSPQEVEMLTWERGAGFTMACGTGATSTVIAGYKLGLLEKNVLVHLPGGDLKITVYEKDNKLGGFMEGDAVSVFEGIMELDL
ncbi:MULTISPECIES: diaminopimelate epimerase [Methanobacterium]|jgi:diaminopimelate epimerase|uniref:Diaminopimelate epimerase n=1 Tax=Methanobacterium subterraneum TaxID=59277 RepID=A0A2H4VRY7_9EURY|nr:MULTISPECIES: diaminopimelate epimerase [Methanobacterium]AUB57748.1 diaminopimelate epimerase [Methanobacterium sp. MZ-A1]AUB60861.1 diaminopimelate epimerase [Methanobacterium subterraneum]NMO09020.1 diaminopimelate epimerase [Methanobacterium subterraneum]